MKRHLYASFRVLPWILLVPALAAGIACRRRMTTPLTTVQASSVQPADSTIAVARDISAPLPVAWEAFKVQGRKSIAALELRIGAERFAAMLKVNRVDRLHIRNGDTLLVPSSGDLIAFSPFPRELEPPNSINKLILVSRRTQAFGAYESGKLVRWGPTSTGKKSTPTPAGLYHTNWKARETRSTVDRSWVLPWCFNIDNLEGVSFHKYDLPGYPASHGCIRLLEEDAKWIYDWADSWKLSKDQSAVLAYGTPVVVFGNYAYGERPPWKHLAEGPQVSSTSLADIQPALDQDMPRILARARERESVLVALSGPAN